MYDHMWNPTNRNRTRQKCRISDGLKLTIVPYPKDQAPSLKLPSTPNIGIILCVAIASVRKAEIKHIMRDKAPMSYRNASVGIVFFTSSKFAIALSKFQALFVKQSTA